MWESWNKRDLCWVSNGGMRRRGIGVARSSMEKGRVRGFLRKSAAFISMINPYALACFIPVILAYLAVPLKL